MSAPTFAVSARIRDGEGPRSQWGNCEFQGRSLDTAIRTAARKLGLRGLILTTQRVGADQYDINVDGRSMMLIIKAVEVPS